MSAGMEKTAAAQSACKAFNVLAGIWKIRAAPVGSDLTRGASLKRTVSIRGLRIYEFSGNAETLRNFDCPAILELNLPGKDEKRFAALTGIEKDMFVLEPMPPGIKGITEDNLNKIWSGRGFVFWKNYKNLPAMITPAIDREEVKKFQHLLKFTGSYKRKPSGKYDRYTEEAVRRFQSNNGIRQDGIAGYETQMILYRSIEDYHVPRLARK